MDVYWNLQLRTRNGDFVANLAEYDSVSIEFSLADPSILQFSIDAESDLADNIIPLTTDLIVYRNNVKMFRGRVGYMQLQGGHNRQTYTVTCHDYRGVLNKRRVNSPLTYTDVDQSTILWNLVQHAQSQTGGALGITRGSGQSTGVTRTRDYVVGKQIFEAGKQLSEVIDGFEWDISPDLVLDVFYPQRGSVKGLPVLKYGSSVVSFSRTINTEQYGNVVIVHGDESTTPVVLAANNVDEVPEGRLELEFTFSDVSRQNTLQEHAQYELAKAVNLQPSYSLVLSDDVWSGPDTFWLGDTVRFVAQGDNFNITNNLRIHNIDITLIDAFNEEIRVAMGAPKPRIRLARIQSDILAIARR